MDAVPTAADVIVLGAGAGGMAAAVAAAAHGMSVLLLEKSPQVGGTTAISGGMVWLPCNRKMAAPDSIGAATQYLAATVPGEAQAAARDIFLREGDRTIAWLEANSALRLRPVPVYPDYYPDLPGATTGGRVLEPEPFDARALGADFALLRPPLPEFTLFGGMMVARPDIAHFRRVFRSWRSTLRVARVVADYAVQRLRHHRGTSLVLGNALVGRLLLSLRQRGVELRLNAAVAGLVLEAGRVAGVRLRDGSVLRATRGVVLAGGGFGHDAALREALMPTVTQGLSATSSDASGDGIRMAREAGAALATGVHHNALYCPVSRFTRGDGSMALYPHTVTDRAKPGLLAVGRDGRRFTNEAVSYHEFVQAMLRAQSLGPEGCAWLVCDADFLWRYGLGAIRPFTTRLHQWIAQGYITQAPSLQALAAALGIDAGGLAATVARYNADAAGGADTLFGRGANAYQRFLGDADVQPNPCLAPLIRAPFYAVRVFPGDLGTAAGLATDARGAVLDASGAPIAGLFACGNDRASIFNGAYPGPGITLGPALVFGVLVAEAISTSRDAGATA